MAVPMICWKNMSSYWKWLLVRIMSRNDFMVPGRGEFSGRSAILFLMCWIMVSMPSLCGILLYIETTSAMTRQAPYGRLGRLRVSERKCLVSLVNDGSAFMYGCRKWLTYDDMFSVEESLAETMGHRGQLGLCTFGNP